MIIAGLTGGIASGKSTVAGFLEKAGALIIDADRIARQVVAPGLPAWQAIRDRFGDTILTEDGSLDRARLGDIVFNDEAARRDLERIVHPRVGAEIDARIRQFVQNDPQSVVIMDIPLLFETGRTEGLTEIIVVYVSEDVQQQRLMRRDRFSEREARARMTSQMPMEEKKRRATIVIDNNGDLEETRRQTLTVYKRLADLAGKIV